MHNQSLNLGRQARVTLAPEKKSQPDSVHTQTTPDTLSKVSQQEPPSKSQPTPAPKEEPRPNKAANHSLSPRKGHQGRVTKQASRRTRVTKEESRRTVVAKQEPHPEIHETSIARQESRPRRSLAHIQARANHNPSPSKSHQARLTPNPCRQAKPPNKSHAQMPSTNPRNLSRQARVTPKKEPRPDKAANHRRSPSKSHAEPMSPSTASKQDNLQQNAQNEV